MRRGDLVTISASGDYGKPRPALVIQADRYLDLSSITVLMLTSDLHDRPAFRIDVAPTNENGLRRASQIMIDRSVSLPRAKIGAPFGCLDVATMSAVSHALRHFHGLDDLPA